MSDDDFTRRWICSVSESIRWDLKQPAQMQLLESCGRACARAGAVKSAQACGGDLSKFESQMRRWVGKSNIKTVGCTVHIVYDKCYCRLDDEVSWQLGDIYCYCSLGWLKEMFETVLGKPVKAEFLESIKRGGEKCRFVVHLPK
jgi:predicted hydrocarbon binding protein